MEKITSLHSRKLLFLMITVSTHLLIYHEHSGLENMRSIRQELCLFDVRRHLPQILYYRFMTVKSHGIRPKHEETFCN